MCKPTNQHRTPTPCPERHPCRGTAWADLLARLTQAKRCQHGAAEHWDELASIEKDQLREAALALFDMFNFTMSCTEGRTEGELFDLLRSDWPTTHLEPQVAKHERLAGSCPPRQTHTSGDRSPAPRD